MRIVCERCGAAFAVDESRVPESGARAACPRCKNIVILRRPTSAAPPPDPLAGTLDSPTFTSSGGLFPATTAPPLPPDPLQRDGRMTGEYAVPDALAAAIASAMGRVTGSFPADRPTGTSPRNLDEAIGYDAPYAPSATPAFGTTAPGGFTFPPSAPTPVYGTMPPGMTPAYGVPLPDRTPAFGQGFPSAPTPTYGSPGATPPNQIGSPSFDLGDLFSQSQTANGQSPGYPQPQDLGAYAQPAPTPPMYMPPAHSGGPVPYVPPARTFDPVPFTNPGQSSPTPYPPAEFTGTNEISAAFVLTGSNPLGDLSGPTLEPSAQLTGDTSNNASDEWRIKKPEGVVEGPFNGQELQARFEAGLIQASDLIAQGNDSFRPLSSYAFTAGFARGRPAPNRVIKAFASSDRGPFPWRPVLSVMAVLAGAVAGAFVIATRPAWLFGAPVAASDAGALSIIDSWRDRAPPNTSSAQELFALARTYYAADTRESYRLAAETFKLVLVKDRRDLKAMSGFAEVRAILAIEDGDAGGLQESAELLAYALRHGDNTPEPHVARANLLTATGTAADLLVAQREASRAQRMAPENPDVLLCTGRSFAQTNAEYALDVLTKAQKIDPKMRQLPVLLGQVYLRMGRIAEARAAFEQRKKLVPEDETADLLLAELDASIGRYDRARDRLSAAGRENPRSVDARLLSAIFLYQIDGKLQQAHDELMALRLLPLDRKRKLKVAIHAAAVAQQLGLSEEAEALIKSGQELDFESAPLLFRTSLLRLAQGRIEDAKKAFEKIEQQIPDPTQRAVLGGRIRAAMGEIDIAQAKFSRAMDYSPHDATAYLLGAAMYAQIGAQGPALALIRRSLNADPSWDRSHKTVGEFFDGQTAVTLAVGAFEALATGQDEVALTQSALAVARYHIGDTVGAEHAAKLALEDSDGTLAAHIYLGQIDLDRHRPAQALKELEAAWERERRCPTVPYLLGRSLAQLGRYDEAHAKFLQALDIDVNFLPARVRDAEVVAQMGQKDKALKLYKDAFKKDPEDLDVRRGLDALEQGELPPMLDVAIEVPTEPETP
jgi:predicted Zn finger-like uncharacterized protein